MIKILFLFFLNQSLKKFLCPKIFSSIFLVQNFLCVKRFVNTTKKKKNYNFYINI